LPISPRTCSGASASDTSRGAFSGAVIKKVGVLSVADGGTVFLDEVGELIVDARAMMLRFLQSGEGRPAGEVRTAPAGHPRCG
jgi:transcriptional regulator with GAF, ATPase, and Fis domain